MHGSDKFDECKSQIVGFTKVDLSSITEDDTMIPAVNNLGAATFKSHINVAIVVTEDHAVKVCNRFIGTSKKCELPWNYKISPTVVDAEEWVLQISE